MNSSAISSSSNSAVGAAQYARANAISPVKIAADSDGDNDGTKPGQAEAPQPRPISSTVGNLLNTTA